MRFLFFARFVILFLCAAGASNLGQYKEGDEWKTFYTGTTVDSDFQTSNFKPFTVQYVRLNIQQSKDGPSIGEFQLLSKP